jgi:transcriptional regulator with XRE-family HTH domain
MYQNIRELRKSLKLTQKEFADRLGVSQPRIGESESSGFLSDALKEKIETTFNVVLKSDKTESTESPNWVSELLSKIEKNWENERQFLLDQIAKKDKMLDALTEKLVKVEVANWPPMFPIAGELGLATEVQLRVA